MFNKLMDKLKSLPLSDKYLLGVSIVVLASHQLAMIAALLVVLAFAYKIGSEVLKD